MRTELECIPCALRQTIRSIRFSGSRRGEAVMRRALRVLLEADWSVPPMALGFDLFAAIREELGVDDPYKREKERLNALVAERAGELRRVIWGSSDPLDTAVRLSIAGNIMDYGSHGEFDVWEAARSALKAEPPIYEVEALREALSGAKRVLLFLDNAGEAVLDLLLAETIKRLYGPEIIAVAREQPMINDVTVEEARTLGFEGFGEVRGMPSGGLGEWLGFRGTLEKWLDEADAALSKGQGNYELLSGLRRGIFFLFTVKCPVVARSVGAPEGSPVLARI